MFILLCIPDWLNFDWCSISDVFLESPTGFTVDAKSVTPVGEGKVRAIVTSPSGQRTESLVKNNKDGTYDVLYTPYEQGE